MCFALPRVTGPGPGRRAGRGVDWSFLLRVCDGPSAQASRVMRRSSAALCGVKDARHRRQREEWTVYDWDVP